jgi:ATP-dependent DNA ligase
VIADTSRIRYCDHIAEQVATPYRLADELFDGIVAKHADAPYPSIERRSKDRIKIKTAHERHVDEERAECNER